MGVLVHKAHLGRLVVPLKQVPVMEGQLVKADLVVLEANRRAALVLEELEEPVLLTANLELLQPHPLQVQAQVAQQVQVVLVELVELVEFFQV